MTNYYKFWEKGKGKKLMRILEVRVPDELMRIAILEVISRDDEPTLTSVLQRLRHFNDRIKNLVEVLEATVKEGGL